VKGFRRILLRIATLFRSGKAEADLAREMRAHLLLLEDEFVARGMGRQEASYAARRTFGGGEQAKEHQRDARGFRWLAGWPMDLKLGVRMLIKSPGLTIIAVVALAIAIAAGAAYLEFVRDVFGTHLRVAGGEIVGIQVWNSAQRAPESRALAAFADWRDKVTTIDQLGALRYLDRHLITDDGRTEPARGVEISASVFRSLNTRPSIGRTLIEDDERVGAPPVVVIGHDLWQARFNGDAGIVGRTAHLGSIIYTIVGVMPADFGFPMNQNLWAPLKVPAAGLKRGEGPTVRMFGRLKEGITLDTARAELDGILAASVAAYAPGTPRPDRRPSADVRPFVNVQMSADPDPLRLPLLYSTNLLFLMLLGICGANVATLVFARTATREAEITVRTALGASRGRISAQLFAEALVLSGVAAVMGLVSAGYVGAWIKWLFMQGEPAPFWWDDRLRPETIFYALALAVLAAVIVGIIPALKATGRELQHRLREAGSAGSMKFGRLWTGVIVTQVAITMICLTSMVTLGFNAYREQHDYDVTFARQQFLVARMVVDQDLAGSGGRGSTTAYRALADTLMSEPGVANVTYGTHLPATSYEPFQFEFATADVASDARFWARSAGVGPNYFETLGIPLVAGRLFTESEIEGSRPVAIVDETFVRLIMGGRHALGLMIREPRNQVTGSPGPSREIVGVVKDVTLVLRKRADNAMVYRPAAIGSTSSMQLFIGTRGAASALSTRLQAAALSANPDMRLADVMSLDRAADRDALAMRTFLPIFVVVAVIALLLSTAGIYALVSFTVSRRTREMGIRMALGAAPRRITTNIFSRAFLQIVVGALAGGVPSVSIAAFGDGDVFSGVGLAAGLGVTCAVGALVFGVSVISCLVPLRRALRVDPMQALRIDA
jgi:putative ABC transport system permease protein